MGPGSVFPSDLYIQPGDQQPVVTEDLGAEMCELYRGVGIFAHEEPVRRLLDPRPVRVDPFGRPPRVGQVDDGTTAMAPAGGINTDRR